MSSHKMLYVKHSVIKEKPFRACYRKLNRCLDLTRKIGQNRQRAISSKTMVWTRIFPWMRRGFTSLCGEITSALGLRRPFETRCDNVPCGQPGTAETAPASVPGQQIPIRPFTAKNPSSASQQPEPSTSFPQTRNGLPPLPPPLESVRDFISRNQIRGTSTP